MGALGVNRFWITTLGSPARGLSVLRWLMKAMWDPRTLVSARQEVFDGVLRMAGVVRSVISTRFLVQCGWPIGVRWCNRSLCWGCWARRGALTLVHLVYKRIWWNLAKLVFVIPIFEIYLSMSFNHIGEQKSLLAGRSFFFFFAEFDVLNYKYPFPQIVEGYVCSLQVVVNLFTDVYLQ